MLLSHISLLLLCLLFAGDFLSLFQLVISSYPFFYSLSIFRKYVEKFQISLKPDKNSWYFT